MQKQRKLFNTQHVLFSGSIARKYSEDTFHFQKDLRHVRNEFHETEAPLPPSLKLYPRPVEILLSWEFKHPRGTTNKPPNQNSKGESPLSDLKKIESVENCPFTTQVPKQTSQLKLPWAKSL